MPRLRPHSSFMGSVCETPLAGLHAPAVLGARLFDTVTADTNIKDSFHTSNKNHVINYILLSRESEPNPKTWYRMYCDWAG
jgi:hypothetical protein